MREEQKLVKRLKQGEPRAFEELLAQYGPQLHRLTLRYASSTDAEDLLQEIFVEVWRSVGGFRGQSALSTWLYRIAVNKCLRHCERNKKSTDPLDDRLAGSNDDAPYRQAVKSETSDRVHTAVDRLPSGQRDVVILCEIQGLTYAECAEVLEIPLGTVKSRLSYAARSLRESLREYVMNPDSEPGGLQPVGSPSARILKETTL